MRKTIDTLAQPPPVSIAPNQVATRELDKARTSEMSVAISDKMLLTTERRFDFDMVGLLKFDPRCLQCKCDAKRQFTTVTSQSVAMTALCTDLARLQR
jgi:hypothetical protein